VAVTAVTVVITLAIQRRRHMLAARAAEFDRLRSLTQRIEPPLVAADDAIHTPVAVRNVALPERLLAKNVTAAEAKSLLDADTDRMESKADGRERKPVKGYSDEARRTAYRRVSKAVPTKREGLDDSRKNNAKQRGRDWLRRAKEKQRRGLSQKAAAKEIANENIEAGVEGPGKSWRYIEAFLSRRGKRPRR
jgi:hypothetical protein